ncbi:MAG TPA: type II secretion system protein N [Steroidobacteraceae bacterium]|nr:type II secretion system protein N [Steroidobacteraceae bacterium]
MSASKRRRWLIATAIVVFIGVLLVQFPASWASAVLPRGIACRELEGTLWSGRCSGIVIQGSSPGDLAWTLHPLKLLVGRLKLDLALEQNAGPVRGTLELAPGGAFTLRNLHGAIPLDHELIGAVPASLHGLAQADFASIVWDGRKVATLEGQLDAHGLRDDRTVIGDYRVSFPGGQTGEPVGQLSDLGGPFSAQGTVRLTAQPGYLIQGMIAPRGNVPADVLEALRFLGPPDAQGRRPFSLEASYTLKP